MHVHERGSISGEDEATMRASNLMVIQYVYDMPRAIAFYRDALGLRVVSESPGWSMLSCGDALVGLGPGVVEGLSPHAGLNLQADNLESAIADVCKAGGSLRTVREPEPPRVPVRLAEMLDSEGNAFELRQYV
jgi:predicted enzyme related to lactoylglutathione lyase